MTKKVKRCYLQRICRGREQFPTLHGKKVIIAWSWSGRSFLQVTQELEDRERKSELFSSQPETKTNK